MAEDVTAFRDERLKPTHEPASLSDGKVQPPIQEQLFGLAPFGTILQLAAAGSASRARSRRNRNCAARTWRLANAGASIHVQEAIASTSVTGKPITVMTQGEAGWSVVAMTCSTGKA